MRLISYVDTSYEGSCPSLNQIRTKYSTSVKRKITCMAIGMFGIQRSRPPLACIFVTSHWKSWRWLRNLIRYLLSYVYLKSLQALSFLSASLSATHYRSINLVAVQFLVWIVLQLQILSSGKQKEPERAADDKTQFSRINFIHNAVSICLFPPLFFFYGLYYTDVLSALSVIFAYKYYVEKKNDITVVAVGLTSLLFRQTNIFWVGVFLGSLAMCRALRQESSGEKLSEGSAFAHIANRSFEHGFVYDPGLSEASIEGLGHHEVLPMSRVLTESSDYLKVAVSYTFAAAGNIPMVLTNLRPYLVVLASFAIFIIWNGGVVLGTISLLLSFAQKYYWL